MEDPQNKDGKLITVPGICHSAFFEGKYIICKCSTASAILVL